LYVPNACDQICYRDLLFSARLDHLGQARSVLPDHRLASTVCALGGTSGRYVLFSVTDQQIDLGDDLVIRCDTENRDAMGTRRASDQSQLHAEPRAQIPQLSAKLVSLSSNQVEIV
jgi:hypothetical protein